MVEQALQHKTSVLWATSTPPTKQTQGPILIPGTPRTLLVPLAGLELSKEANYRITPRTVSFEKWSICKSLVLELLTGL